MSCKVFQNYQSRNEQQVEIKTLLLLRGTPCIDQISCLVGKQGKSCLRKRLIIWLWQWSWVSDRGYCCSVTYEELRTRYLQFSVYDFDRFSRHDLIGQVVLKGLLDCTDLLQEIEYTMNVLCAPQVCHTVLSSSLYQTTAQYMQDCMKRRIPCNQYYLNV